MDLYPPHLATWSRDRLERAIRHGVQTAYLGNDLVLARILGRHKIFLRGSDRGFACHLMLDGFCERTRIVPQALGAAAGTALLFAPEGEPKNTLVVGQPDLPGGRTHAVPVATLDSIALDGPRVDLVKIDAEGAEESIVAGMRGLLERDRPMLVLEYNAARYADPGGFLDALLAVYGEARELDLDGQVVPLDRGSVTDPGPRTDRLLVFG